MGLSGPPGEVEGELFGGEVAGADVAELDGRAMCQVAPNEVMSSPLVCPEA